MHLVLSDERTECPCTAQSALYIHMNQGPEFWNSSSYGIITYSLVSGTGFDLEVKFSL